MGGAFGVTNYAPGAGGLQSSPNVPAPGSSIDPSTGKQFSAGMTRAELEAKKAAELSGREQAARQLAGPGLAAGPSELDVITPGKELPGGWGRESLAVSFEDHKLILQLLLFYLHLVLPPLRPLPSTR
jgi:hypothetical protein